MKKIIYIILAAGLAIFSVSAANTTAKKGKSTKTVKTTKSVSAKPVEQKQVERVVIKDRTLSSVENDAVKLYNKAYENYVNKKYSDALKELNQIDDKLGKPTARVAYLEAKIEFEQNDYKSALASCNAYLKSNPCKDGGYAEMEAMSSQLNSYLKAQQDAKEQEEKERVANELQAKQDKQLATEKENANIAAARTRKKELSAERRKVRMEKESAELEQVRSTNTRDAYQQFIDQYPYGKMHTTAVKEMNQKWPFPTRSLNKKNDKYGYVDAKGNYVVKAKYDNASEFVDERARVGKSGNYGFVDKDGKEVIPLIYKSATNFSFGYSAVKEANGDASFIDKSGNKLGDKNFRDAKAFSEGLAAVADEYMKYGFINTTGEYVIAPEYDIVFPFHNGVAVVGRKINGKYKYGYIDNEGELVTEIIYDEAKDFQRGTGRVKRDGKYALIDNTGAALTGFVYDFILDFRSDGYARAKRDNIEVLLDATGTPWANVNGNMIQVKMKN